MCISKYICSLIVVPHNYIYMSVYMCKICVILVNPEAPRSLHVAKETTSSVSLEWTEPLSDGGSSVNAYIVEMKGPDDSDFHKVGQVDGEKCSYTAAQLVRNSEYDFRVLAENEAGQSIEAATLESAVKLRAKASEC